MCLSDNDDWAERVEGIHVLISLIFKLFMYVWGNFVMDREAWRAAIHGVEKSRTSLSDSTEAIL